MPPKSKIAKVRKPWNRRPKAKRNFYLQFAYVVCRRNGKRLRETGKDKNRRNAISTWEQDLSAKLWNIYLNSNLPFPHSFGGGRDRVPAGVRGRRSQAEKARGDVARSGRKDRKDALQNLEKVEKNSFVLVTEKCCTALCYESAPTIEALLQRGKWISLAIAISFYGGKPGISIKSCHLPLPFHLAPATSDSVYGSLYWLTKYGEARIITPCFRHNPDIHIKLAGTKSTYASNLLWW